MEVFSCHLEENTVQGVEQVVVVTSLGEVVQIVLALEAVDLKIEGMTDRHHAVMEEEMTGEEGEEAETGSVIVCGVEIGNGIHQEIAEMISAKGNEVLCDQQETIKIPWQASETIEMVGRSLLAVIFLTGRLNSRAWLPPSYSLVSGSAFQLSTPFCLRIWGLE